MVCDMVPLSVQNYYVLLTLGWVCETTEDKETIQEGVYSSN